MSWTALVPLKQAGIRKSRLDARLTPLGRARLAEFLTRHVIATLLCSRAISSVVLLSDVPLAGVDVEWMPDGGSGLNDEIRKAVAKLDNRPLVIFQGDLPWLNPSDVGAMIRMASGGASIAPDRHGLGTNALALMAPHGFPFAFGAHSFATHVPALGKRYEVVRRRGLAFDIDTASDLDEALAAGLAFDITM